jgi:hypothetical protein
MGESSQFRALSKYGKRPVVLKALLYRFQEEERLVIVWYKAFLEEQPRHENIDQDDMLVQCMRKFPKRTMLLTFLLDKGVSPNAKMDYGLCAGWKPEPCTALIRVLFHRSEFTFFGGKQKIENDVILLLSRGDAGTMHPYHAVFPDD